ncbi:MAG: hypothetical protein LBM62_01095 [Mediterranea sp.]|nr:hypothetical protein [Mediterranea sp.]
MIVTFAALCTTTSVNAQREYVRLNAGSDFSSSFSLKVAYGIDMLHWLDAGLSLGIDNSLPLKSDDMSILVGNNDAPTLVMHTVEHVDGKLNASLMLNVHADAVKVFVPASRHGIKIGAGVGTSYYHRINHLFNPSPNDSHTMAQMSHQMVFAFDYTVSVMYEYALTKKVAVGIWGEYKDLPELVLYGVSIRRSF